MHILLVCKTLPHVFQGGIQTHTWKLSEHLIKRGHSVSILTSGSFKHRKQPFTLEQREIIEIPYLPLRKMPFLATFGDEWAFNIAASQWLLKHHSHFDLIHLQGRSGCLFLEHKSQVQCPIISTIHGFKSDEYGFEAEKEQKSLGLRRHAQFAKRLENLAIGKSDALLVVSRFLEEKVLTLQPNAKKRLFVVPNGIEIGALPETQAPSNRLLFVGRLDRLKGVHDLLYAINLSQKKVTLTIVGDGAERKNLEAQTQKLGLNHRVRFLGALNQDGVVQAIREAEALILPSYLETQGIVLMEANVQGKPVLASAIPGIREVVEEGRNGLLFPPGDSVQMAQAIDQMFAQPRLARFMGKTGYYMMQERFAWEKIAACTEKIYNSVHYAQLLCK